MMVPLEVGAFLPFQTAMITAFCSTNIITDGWSGIIFFKGSLVYTQATLYHRVEESSSKGFGQP